MSLAHAILVILAECPKSGYDLAKRFDGSVGFFWNATHQQIYRELHKLEANNWIIGEEIAQVGRPDKKVFALTPAGKQELQRWIAEPSALANLKDEFLVKVFAGHVVSKDVIQKQLEHQRQLHVEQLAVYRNIEKQFFSTLQAVPLIYQFQYLTLRRGIRLEEDEIAWCDEALQMLQQM